MTQSSKKSPTTSNSLKIEPREVWLSGSEHINLVTDLLIQPVDATRGSGRTSKLALQYAMMALKVPHHKIRIIDHFRTNDSHYRLQKMVCDILDVLKIDYEIGRIDGYVRDPNSFTGVVKSDDGFYITAKPKDPIPD